MIVHDKFIFLQMRKTASTFVADALQRELPSGTVSNSQGKHADWARIPPEARGRPVLVYVRNPWDWYVSWYHFNLMLGGTPNGYWRMLSDNGALSLRETVGKACSLSKRIMGADLYSTLFRNLVGDGMSSELLTVGRFEHLIDDLERFLSAVNVTLPDGCMARIRNGTPIKASNHGPYAEYYDDELRDLVAEFCAPLIGRFGYRF